MPVIDLFLVVHQLPRPLHSPDAEEKQCQTEGEAEQEVSGIGSQWTEVDPDISRNREIDDNEPDRQQRHQAEECGYLAGCPIGSPFVDIGEPWDVGLQTRIRNRVSLLVDCCNLCAGPVAGVVAHLAFAPLAAIHTAKQIKPPRPMVQPQKPSLTGPRPPSARPPSLGRSCRALR